MAIVAFTSVPLNFNFLIFEKQQKIIAKLYLLIIVKKKN